MKEEFKNKLICYLGASTDEHGWYMDYMRRYISTQEDKCYILNRAIGGNYCNLALRMLDDEVFSCNPDIVFVKLGGNDVGMWRYDLKYKDDAKIQEEIKKCDEKFYTHIRLIVEKIKAKGIKVYIVTPGAENEMIEEKENIESVFDNQDKAKNLKSSFYKRESLKKVNDKLEIYAEYEKKLAEELGVGYIDLFHPHRELVKKYGDLHDEDGVHSNKKGHMEIAKIFLKALGYTDIPENLYVKNDTCSVINQLEQIERHIQFFRRYKFYPEEEKPFKEIETDEQVIEFVRKEMKKPDYQWKTMAVVADAFYDKFFEIRKRILELVKSF